MTVNPAYLIECILYEKCLQEANEGDYVSEFQRALPHLFQCPFTITPEIAELDRSRRKLSRELRELDADTARYNDVEDALWYAYRYEVNAFYDANKPKVDAILEHYQQFLTKEPAKETVLFKLVRTPAGYWFATNHQSWLVARYPFQWSYTCKALGVYFSRWLKRVIKRALPARKLNHQTYAA